MSDLDLIYDFIVDYSIATTNEIELVTCIKGWNKTSLNDIIEVRTGYHDMDQYLECEGE
tara:strand:+ start:775 stop:951 length:177 start_codon:yes stop_codon:yes gene_type:complete